MTKEVLITVRGVQLLGGEADEIELVVRGTYYYKNGSHYLLYEEQPEGLPEPIRNMVKARPGMLEIRKKGAVSTQLIFDCKGFSISRYNTPYGALEIGVETARVEIEDGEELLVMEADYTLAFNGRKTSDCAIRIEVRPAC